ncbi:MAG: hypothetical protein EOO38_24835 [Cytophagaceae bacterium]|nr:MAG: hypothetical protein EOO38_24835 [Cytophagaceae bacterium]
MENIAQNAGVFNAPNENGIQAKPAFSSSYACTSVTTSLGLRRHTLTTQNRTLYHAFYAQVLNMDDQPDFVAVGGTFSIQFYADDAECDAVIEAALGGKA